MVRPTLRQLAYLLALEDEKSFSKAAAACLVTQSTLSAGISDLENVMGQPLVNRRGRAITLTPLGAETAAGARKILNDVDSLVRRAQQTQAPLSGPLRLGVIPTIAPYLLPKILPGLRKRFPALELQLHEDMSARLIERLHQGKLDGVLMAFPYDTGGMEEHILFEERFLLAVPENSEYPETVALKSLKPEGLLLLDDGHCLRDHALSACKLQLPRTRRAFSATSLPTLIRMVEHGFGITLLPEMAAAPDALPKGVRTIPFRSPAPSRKIGLTWPPGSPHARDMAALADALSVFLAKS